ncbi:uncharacterized protein APUU_70054A [Aspergillus puulaauensis]|uniref:Granulins domain-containing protein n=1 Tax=Aspergillus puulaauensis TaxID=1220207 RepID=A0A7R7XXD3_9EURO|nr:uncharacterized protein APUU_70054A [Aspergillus puulaauensis]BCS28484.1 hypothetical protein APUU_70054A [Aspergillus puulaauensis]
MSLNQTLLYLLSLSSISFANQDVLDADRDSGRDYRALVTKTITYNEQTPLPAQNITSDFDSLSCQPDEKQCNDSCIPSTQDCCSADHCFPGDYCYHHSGKAHCCPQGLECFQISGHVCFDQKILWYDEVHIVEEDSDEVVTAWDLHESVRRAKTRLTVTASYPSEGRSSYSELSSRVVRAAATSSVVLDSIATRTITFTSSPTSELGDSWAGPAGVEGVKGQAVLG